MLLPFTLLMVYLSWPFFCEAGCRAKGREAPAVSSSGPVGWRSCVGFVLLFLQAVSELIKRIAITRGVIPDPSPEHPAHHVPIE